MTTQEAPIRLGIVGTGGIGNLHVQRAAENPLIDLVGMSSLDDDAEALASEVGVELFRDFRDLVSVTPDAVLIATPNQTHLEIGAFFAKRGVHLLVEKPITDDRESGRQLCEIAEQCNVHLLVGHHRRYQNLVRAAKEFVATDIGKLVATQTMVTMRKPDSYYETEWRRSKGAGPLLVNLIHEIDLLRAVCGEITHVQAAAAKIGRTFDFDDTATIIFHFASGALGTLVITESTPSPWSWEASVSDGMGFYNAGQDHAQFVGTNGSLGFPSLTAWRYDPAESDPGWESPLQSAQLKPDRNNPYTEQLSHLARVVRGVEQPLVTGRDGLRNLIIVDAVVLAAETGSLIEVDNLT